MYFIHYLPKIHNIDVGYLFFISKTGCKLVTDQWRASLGVRDSESCWFTEEIGTYMRCRESL
jgi:hypothetical protein